MTRGPLSYLRGRRQDPPLAPRHAAPAPAPRVPVRLRPALTAGQDDLADREREVIAAHAPCQTAPNGTGQECECDFACANYWLLVMRQRPKFTAHARPVAAITMPMPVTPARPYAPPVQGRTPLDHGTPQWPGVRPVIGDAMQEQYPAPPPPEPPAPDCAALPYTGEGWAGLQMRRWLERGEWKPFDSALPAAFEANAAAQAVAHVRVQAGIIRSLELGCTDLELPGLAATLWRRASEHTKAHREAAAAAGGAR